MAIVEDKAERQIRADRAWWFMHGMSRNTHPRIAMHPAQYHAGLTVVSRPS